MSGRHWQPAGDKFPRGCSVTLLAADRSLRETALTVEPRKPAARHSPQMARDERFKAHDRRQSRLLGGGGGGGGGVTRWAES